MLSTKLKAYKNPAVVIGGGVTGLGIIRNLGRNGVDVYCVVDEKNEAVFSKYCREYFVFPGVEYDLEKLKTFLTKLKRRLPRKAVIFPTSDISVLNVSRLISGTSDYLSTITSQEVLETLVKKRKFYHSLIKRKVSHPVTLLDISEIKNISRRMSFPVYVRPSISEIFSKKFGKKGFVANSERDLHRYLRLMDKLKIDVMIQEIVPGPVTNYYNIDGYLDKNSRPIVLFARRSLRMWPPSFGNTTACISVPISEVVDMKETIVRYLASIGFHGIFNAEFKRDPRDNVDKLLEVNARSWWHNSFPSACGANIVLTAYLDAVGVEVKTVEDYETGTCLIYCMEDLKCISTLFIQGKLSLRELVSPLAGKKCWTILAKDDLNPFIMSSLYKVLTIKKYRKMIAIVREEDKLSNLFKS